MINTARLAKVWKLTTSPNAGEAAAARERARIIVERDGKSLADIPGLLQRAAASNPPTPSPGGFSFYDINNPDHVAAYAASDRKRRARRASEEAPERAEVLARYGGPDAVLVWTVQEQLLRAAVARWTIFQNAPNERWVKNIDGIGRPDSHKMPAHVLRALSDAYPLPATITDAAAEYAAWEKRDRDLGLALEDTTDSQLDLPAYCRRDIVCQLLETGLQAASLDEVAIRQRHLVKSEFSNPEIEKAVLADIEALLVQQHSELPNPSTPSKRQRGYQQPGLNQADLFG